MKYAELTATAQKLIDNAITAHVCMISCKEEREYAQANQLKGEKYAYVKAAGIVDGFSFADAHDAMVDRIIATGREYLLTY